MRKKQRKKKVTIRIRMRNVRTSQWRLFVSLLCHLPLLLLLSSLLSTVTCQCCSLLRGSSKSIKISLSAKASTLEVTSSQRIKVGFFKRALQHTKNGGGESEKRKKKWKEIGMRKRIRMRKKQRKKKVTIRIRMRNVRTSQWRLFVSLPQKVLHLSHRLKFASL